MTPESLIQASDPLWDVLLRFAYNLAVLFIIIRLFYNRFSDKKGYLFSFFLMGIVIFLVCAVLKGVDIHIGMAFGLFALFSIVRYRTKNIAIKEMSYLFTIMGISAINALINFPHPVRGALLINSIVILTIFILELTFKKENKKDAKKEKGPITFDDSLVPIPILYDNLALLDPAKMNELIQDVSSRTKIAVEKIQLRRIDLIQGNAELDAFYKPSKPDNAI